MRVPRRTQNGGLPLPAVPRQSVRRTDGLRHLRPHDREFTPSSAELPPPLSREAVPADVSAFGPRCGEALTARQRDPRRHPKSEPDVPRVLGSVPREGFAAKRPACRRR